MFKKVLVANRGEIAVRAINTLKEMGIQTVSIYSKADKKSYFVSLADESFCVGMEKAEESYLNIQNIISVALLSGCDAIYPGYGFLAENSDFAEICENVGIKFIGPSADVMRKVGNKLEALKYVRKLSIPVIPGSLINIDSLQICKKIAKKVGFPLMLKASSGGGGKGIRLVNDEKSLAKSYQVVKLETQSSFSNSNIYVEKLIKPARHIEVQFIKDNYGKYIIFPERDCSLQRNHQKCIEETPCKFISSYTRNKVKRYTQKIIENLDYENTGTVEYLIDSKQNIYFMEINARIQVEHGITEELTGINLIKLQIQVGEGEKILVSQSDILAKKSVIECRINAEVPNEHFKPVNGVIKGLNLPTQGPGIRIDHCLRIGEVIPIFYDNMLAKIIVNELSRSAAIKKMNRILNQFYITGVPTNREYLLKLLNDSDFINGNYDTDFLNSREK
ncbi:acetyl-CoA carboxylase biotin carboxylase subunit (plasmid) [Limosilactobacillus reuteri]|uniref:biotin carboxylase n=1 Tax=Limosilactobacillus reuteri TaxID=1598 RepID=A0A3M6SI55_LIMRT|nr:biotin carboxylase N-terminal domain-containing protein [Limosilactobacillus reuteri]RMX27018.1 acetyl-CoA carboxylase biotin carboxylase subunit [Limosilactobacillus reuteri]